MKIRELIKQLEEAVEEAGDDDFEVFCSLGSKELFVDSVDYDDEEGVLELSLTENSGV